MFGKKKEMDIWSAEDYRMKDLLQSLIEHRRVIQTYCREIIIRKGSAEMLPDGADKNVELQEIETRQKWIRNLLAAYEEDLRQYNRIESSLLRHYTGKANQLTPHEVLHVAWKMAYSEVIGK
jgi:hypothetical protein